MKQLEVFCQHVVFCRGATKTEMGIKVEVDLTESFDSSQCINRSRLDGGQSNLQSFVFPSLLSVHIVKLTC